MALDNEMKTLLALLSVALGLYLAVWLTQTYPGNDRDQAVMDQANGPIGSGS